MVSRAGSGVDDRGSGYIGLWLLLDPSGEGVKKEQVPFQCVLEAVLLLTLPSTLNMIHSLPPFLSFVAFAVASEAVLSCLVAASVDRSACG